MIRKLHALALLVAGTLALTATAQAAGPPGGSPSTSGHWAGPNGWQSHPALGKDMHHFNHEIWRGGHWWNGNYGGRGGWWWIVGPNWFWYSEPVYPFPDPFTPAGAAPGYLYYCDYYAQYYPYVGVCPSGWQPVQPF